MTRTEPVFKVILMYLQKIDEFSFTTRIGPIWHVGLRATLCFFRNRGPQCKCYVWERAHRRTKYIKLGSLRLYASSHTKKIKPLCSHKIPET